MLLTTMLRAELDRSVWGSWTLDPVVEPGMVGVVDPLSGIFELHKPRAIPLEIHGSWPADYDVAWAA